MSGSRLLLCLYLFMSLGHSSLLYKGYILSYIYDLCIPMRNQGTGLYTEKLGYYHHVYVESGQCNLNQLRVNLNYVLVGHFISLNDNIFLLFSFLRRKQFIRTFYPLNFNINNYKVLQQQDIKTKIINWRCWIYLKSNQFQFFFCWNLYLQVEINRNSKILQRIIVSSEYLCS